MMLMRVQVEINIPRLILAIKFFLFRGPTGKVAVCNHFDLDWWVHYHWIGSRHSVVAEPTPFHHRIFAGQSIVVLGANRFTVLVRSGPLPSPLRLCSCRSPSSHSPFAIGLLHYVHYLDRNRGPLHPPWENGGHPQLHQPREGEHRHTLCAL